MEKELAIRKRRQTSEIRKGMTRNPMTMEEMERLTNSSWADMKDVVKSVIRDCPTKECECCKCLTAEMELLDAVLLAPKIKEK